MGKLHKFKPGDYKCIACGKVIPDAHSLFKPENKECITSMAREKIKHYVDKFTVGKPDGFKYCARCKGKLEAGCKKYCKSCVIWPQDLTS